MCRVYARQVILAPKGIMAVDSLLPDPMYLPVHQLAQGGCMLEEEREPAACGCIWFCAALQCLECKH